MPRIPRKEAARMRVADLLSQGARPERTHWLNDPKLRGEYYYVKETAINGRKYAGHGSWPDYLKNEHGLAIVDPKAQEDAEQKVNNRIHAAIQELKGNISPKAWQQNKSAQALYRSAQRLQKDGQSFAGHKSWHKYIENTHGIYSILPEHLPDERAHYFIRRELKRLPQTRGSKSSYFWQGGIGSSTPITITKQSRSALFELAKARKVNGKPFFGHGTWKNYLDWLYRYSRSREWKFK